MGQKIPSAAIGTPNAKDAQEAGGSGDATGSNQGSLGAVIDLSVSEVQGLLNEACITTVLLVEQGQLKQFETHLSDVCRARREYASAMVTGLSGRIKCLNEHADYVTGSAKNEIDSMTAEVEAALKKEQGS